MPSRRTDDHEPPSVEQAAENYRRIRRSLAIAVPMAWLVVVLGLARHPGTAWDAVFIALAVFYPIACWLMLRHLKRDIDKRAPRSHELPEVGL